MESWKIQGSLLTWCYSSGTTFYGAENISKFINSYSKDSKKLELSVTQWNVLEKYTNRENISFYVKL